MAPGKRSIDRHSARRDQYTGVNPHQTRSHIRSSRTAVLSPNASQTQSEHREYSISESSSPQDPSDNGEAGPQPEWMASELIDGVRILQNGTAITPTVQAKFEKSFFYSSETHDWTCYRRNYFQIHCGFTLSPWLPFGPGYDLECHGRLQPIDKFAMTISAVVDAKDGKRMPLIQHTAKRDKGPQNDPRMEFVNPRIPKPHPSTLFNNLGGLGGYQNAYEQQQQPHTIEFTRIQFKNATANNGKRRAAQQFYHAIAELYADLGEHINPQQRYVMVARQFSHPVVCRGRSPGHYNDHKDQEDRAYGDPFTPPHPMAPSMRAPSPAVPTTFTYGDQQYQYGGYDSRTNSAGNMYSYPDSRMPATPAISETEIPRHALDRQDFAYRPGSSQEIPSSSTLATGAYYQNPLGGPYTPGTSVYSPPAGYSQSVSSPHYFAQNDRVGSFSGAVGLDQTLTGHNHAGNGLQFNLPSSTQQDFSRLNIEQRQLPPLASNASWGRFDGVASTTSGYHYPSYATPQQSSALQTTYTTPHAPAHTSAFIPSALSMPVLPGTAYQNASYQNNTQYSPPP